jgi:hypothetical protein
VTDPKLSSEGWLAMRMRDHGGGDVFQGVTDIPTRKERMRQAIKGQKLESVIIGASQRRPVTWSAAFERLYGEPV